MGGARPVLKADATTLCQDSSAKNEEPLPDIAHQPHEAEAHARPLRQRGKGDLKLPNLRRIRCAPTPLGSRPSHDRRDLKYLHAPQSRGLRHQHATDVEARPQIRAQPMRGKPRRLSYPDVSALCSIASYIKHRHPATAVETHTQVVPRVTQSILGPASRLGGTPHHTIPYHTITYRTTQVMVDWLK